jgi:hypothetical protein
LPPAAGKLAGVGVAVAPHRTGDGPTLVLVEVDPHAADASSARSVRTARQDDRERPELRDAHGSAGIALTPVTRGVP